MGLSSSEFFLLFGGVTFLSGFSSFTAKYVSVIAIVNYTEYSIALILKFIFSDVSN